MGAKKPRGRPRAGAQGERGGGAGDSPGQPGGQKRYTPEQRRHAVEAYRKAGLTQTAFAAQWGISAVTLGSWLRKDAAEGPKGLERLSDGPAKRRGCRLMSQAVRDEVVAVQRRFAAGARPHRPHRDPSILPRPPRDCAAALLDGS